MKRFGQPATSAIVAVCLSTGAAAAHTQVTSAGQAPPAATAGTSAARVVAIRVHGNHTTPDADVLAIAGVTVGMPATEALETTIRERLENSGRFVRADIRRRFASLSDASAVLLVIVVEERVGITIDVPRPGPMRRLKASTMWQPVLRRDDGYGFTYGARVAFVDLLGPRTRVGVPLTWGGERRLGVELERRFEGGLLSRLIGTAGVTRREHPALGVGDRRTGAAIRGERRLAPWAQVAGAGGIADVSFGGAPDTVTRLAVDLIVDTRRDAAFPRNAIHGTLEVERLWFDTTGDTVRLTSDLRGYVGLFGQVVLAVRGLQVHALDPLPVFEQPLLGGTSTLRGFRLGYRFGDSLAAASAEVRIPFSSPLRAGRVGAAVFVDTGTVHGAGGTLRRARWDTGIGAGLFFQIPLLTVRVDVARGLGAATRAHVTLGITL